MGTFETVLLAVAVAGLFAYGVRALLGGGGKASSDEVERRLSGAKRDAGVDAATLADEDAAKPSSLGEAMSKLARFSKPLEPGAEDASALAMKMAQAGYRQLYAPSAFVAMQMVLFIGGATAAGLYSYFDGKPIQSVVFVAAFVGGVMFLAPKFWLSRAIAARALAITHALPDTLDLLVVSVEAGLGLDAAIQRVSDDMTKAYPELSEEFKLSSKEHQMGVARIEALNHMAERTSAEDVQSLVAIHAQTQRYGASNADALRTHADTMRVKRRQKAEEAANKTAVKLIFPLAIFVFPGIMFVVVVPVMWQMMELFGNVGN